MTTNSQLVDSLVGLIRSLPPAEQNLLVEKLFFESSDYPSSQEIAHLSAVGGAFDFLSSEPDLYSLDDGEPIS
jgi:hypothetical protein